MMCHLLSPNFTATNSLTCTTVRNNVFVPSMLHELFMHQNHLWTSHAENQGCKRCLCRHALQRLIATWKTIWQCHFCRYKVLTSWYIIDLPNSKFLKVQCFPKSWRFHPSCLKVKGNVLPEKAIHLWRHERFQPRKVQTPEAKIKTTKAKFRTKIRDWRFLKICSRMVRWNHHSNQNLHHTENSLPNSNSQQRLPKSKSWKNACKTSSLMSTFHTKGFRHKIFPVPKPPYSAPKGLGTRSFLCLNHLTQPQRV